MSGGPGWFWVLERSQGALLECRIWISGLASRANFETNLNPSSSALWRKMSA